jgi:hypothetical protein
MNMLEVSGVRRMRTTKNHLGIQGVDRILYEAS